MKTTNKTEKIIKRANCPVKQYERLEQQQADAA